MDNLDGWLTDLRSSGSLVLVEGKKDKEALTKLGIANIKTVSQKPLYKTIEEVSESKETVVILTDLDNEGRKYYSYLRHHLQRNGIRVDRKFREYLFKNTKITQIESMKKLI